MALIECPECHKQVSEKAASCPNCGAPVTAVTEITAPAETAATPSSRKWQWRHSIFLGIIILFIVIGYVGVTHLREQSLPPMPVEVQYRKALLGPGLVLAVKNNSARQLSIVAMLNNPSLHQDRTFRMDIAAHGTTELGSRDGWTLASGDTIKLTHADYQPWQGSIP
jgi:hypothetical protein